MAVKWTEEQRQVIENRDHNLLVSAAAGSGKTAVLVERILERVTDPVDPIDVDQLLVVTFTRAAAGEMKDRLQKALEKKLEENPGDEHLQKQGVLLHHAQINTIHGFCQYVIKNYFHRIGLDPSFRIGQESDLQLMRGDILDQLMEDEYEALEGRSGETAAATDQASGSWFGKLVEAYAPGRNDDRIPDLILSLYEKAISNPDPDAWLDECLADYRISTVDELEKSAWIRRITEDTHLLLESSERYAQATLVMADTPDGPQAYLEALKSDLDGIRTLCQADSFAGLQHAFAGFEFQKLGRSSKAQAALEDAERKAQIKDRRDALKKTLSEWQEKYFCDTEEEILQDLIYLRPYVEELVRLTRAFASRYQETKKGKNLADFSDLEHNALKILLEKKDGVYVRTDAARELAAGFREVMVDEYQDSNLIQEALLQAVSGEEEGRHDRFMVGDMKQAIYGFRLARPEIFLEKYYRYGASDGRDGCRRIDLGKNFRSRKEVLDPVNALFQRLMQKSLGGIDYDDAQALHLGAEDYPEWENKNGSSDQKDGENPDRAEGIPLESGNPDRAELILLDSENPVIAESQTTAAEAEALAIAGRIRSLMRSGQVYDRDKGALRPIRCRDMVILLRSTAGTADAYVKVLKSEGIPAYSVSKEGYFSALEVVTVLNYLRLIDNSRQDEALAAILHSPICGFSAEELARIADRGQRLLEIRTEAGGKAKEAQAFYRKVFAYRDRGEDGPLRTRLQAFFEQLAGFRRKAPDTPVGQLITEILDQTGYGAYAAAMPGGAQRQANLKMLVDMAAAFEDGSQHGLFAFIRSIEEQEKYQIDTGEVNLYSENEDIVRIMTIHKSKGLEFPVVFLAGCGKQFNKQDSRAAMVLHPSLGIGLDAVDPEQRLRRTTIRKAVLARATAMDNLAEELRILYVAMTRAKEKLIMTGAVKNLEKLPPDIADAVRQSAYGKPDGDAEKEAGKAVGKDAEKNKEPSWDESPVDYGTLTSANCYLDWILAAYSCGMPITVSVADAESLVKGQEEEDQGIEEKLSLLKGKLAGSETFDPRVREFLIRRNDFSYPYANLLELPAKMTVSDIKKRGYDAETAAILEDLEDRGQELIMEEKTTAYLPAFMVESDQEEEASSGAARGTIYHTFMEHLTYPQHVGAEGRQGYAADVRKQLDRLVEEGIFSGEDAGVIYVRDFVNFLDSDLGRRMGAADRRGQLHREAPFVLEVDAHTIRSEWPDNQTILVQGVIDAWFFEGDEIVLVDYKTDHVYTKDGSDLIRKYRDQFLYYKKALEQLTGAGVKEMQLYSFGLDRAIEVI